MTTRLQGQAESYSISSNTTAKTQEREEASVSGPRLQRELTMQLLKHTR